MSSRKRALFGFVTTIALVAATLPATASPRENADPLPEPGPITDEIESLRTAVSRTFAEADGTFTTALYDSPINYWDGDGWEPISSALRPSQEAGFAWTNQANSFDVHFKDTLADGYLRWGTGEDAIDVTLDGADAVSASVDRSTITYGEAFPAVDLDYEVAATGVKETLILQDASSPGSFTFHLTRDDGLNAEQQEDGNWVVTSADSHELLFQLGRSFAVDAVSDGSSESVGGNQAQGDEPSPSSVESPEPTPSASPSPSAEPTPVQSQTPGPEGQTPTAGPSSTSTPTPEATPSPTESSTVAENPLEPEPSFIDGQPHASTEVSSNPDGSLDVTVAVDPEWLSAPGRTFPVFLDPTIESVARYKDATFWWDCPGCTATTNAQRLQVGRQAHIFRSTLQFDLSGLPETADITDANLRLYYDNTCLTSTGTGPCISDHTIEAHRVTYPWADETSIHTQDIGFDAAIEDSITAGSSSAQGWKDLSLTNLVRDWHSRDISNFGVLVKRDSDASGGAVQYGIQFPSGSFTDSTKRPYLEVTYDVDRILLREPTSLHSNGAELSWSGYPEDASASFGSYEIHRSLQQGFTPSDSNLIGTISDQDQTSFIDTTGAANSDFFYRIVSGSYTSNEIRASLPAEGLGSVTLQLDPSGNATYITGVNGAGCTNFGSKPELLTGSSGTSKYRSLVNYDLSQLAPSSEVQSATLSLWHHRTTFVNQQTIEVRNLTTPWVEGTGAGTCTGDGATWEESEGGIDWRAQGGDWETQTAATTTHQVDPAGWDDFNVTASIQRSLDGESTTDGFLIRQVDEASGAFAAYASDDYSLSPDLRPTLSVVYEDGSVPSGPDVSISGPDPADWVRGNAVTLTADAADDSRVEDVTFKVDGTAVSTDTSKPFSADWNTTLVSNGDHSIVAEAVDDAGNSTQSDAVTLTVANSAVPTISLGSPSAGASITGTQTVTATVTDDGPNPEVTFYVDGLKFGSDTTAPYEASLNTLNQQLPVYDGTHVLTAKVVDATRQSATSAPRTIVVANTSGTKFIAGITSTDIPERMTYNTTGSTPAYGIDVTVVNRSLQVWNLNNIVVRYAWYRRGSSTPLVTSSSYAIPSGLPVPPPIPVLAPTLSRTVRIPVTPPDPGVGTARGAYVLRFDLFDSSAPSGSQSFASNGNAPERSSVTVERDLMAEALGLERYYHYIPNSLGAGLQSLVNAATGNLVLNWQPMSSPGRGLSTAVSLNYNSSQDGSTSPAGNNFSLSISSIVELGMHLDVHPQNADTIQGRSNRYIDLIDADGTAHRFEGHLATDASVYFTEPPGVHLYLRRFSDTNPARYWAATRPDRVTFFFDQDGYPTGAEDANGNKLDFGLQTIQPSNSDPGQQKPTKHIVSVTDAAGTGGSPAPNRTYNIVYYDENTAPHALVRGRVASIADHSGHKLLFSYYNDGNLRRLTEKGGKTATGSTLADRNITFTYTDSDGSGPAITGAAQRANPDPATPNQSSRVYSVIDPRGNETTFDYYGPTTGQLRWKLESITDRAGSTTSFSYDLNDAETTVDAPLSRTTVYHHQDDGSIDSLVDPLGRTTSLTWSSDRQPTLVEYPNNTTTSFDYNANGYVTDVTDEVGNHTVLEYENIAADTADSSIHWGAGRSIPHLSQLSAKTSPNGVATSTSGDYKWDFDYDSAGNLTDVFDPEDGHTIYAYNADGTVSTATDPRGFPTLFENYDANGMSTRITDAEGGVTKLNFDADGLLQWVQDPEHLAFETRPNPTQYRTYLYYDAFHRLGKTTTPKSTALKAGTLVTQSVTFDANDNVVGARQPSYTPLGPETKTTYDAMDRPTLTVVPDTSVDPAGEKTAFSYDTAGRLTSTTLPKGVITSAADDYRTEANYDLLDRVIRAKRFKTDASGTVVETVITHYCYDLAGDLVRVTAPKANLATVDCSAAAPADTSTFNFDDAHRLRTSTDPEGNFVGYDYDNDSNTRSVTDQNGKTTNLFYDQRGLLTKKVEPFSTTRSITTLYRYDESGNLVTLISPRAYDDSADMQNFPYFSTSYDYDKLNRLVRVRLPIAGASDTQTYMHRQYDKNGNLTMTSLPTTVADQASVPTNLKSVMTYFDPGWIATSKDPRATAQNYDYTSEGWQSSRKAAYASGKTRQQAWTYLPDGTLQRFTGFDGNVNTFTYDRNNNVTKAVSSIGSTSQSRPITTDQTFDSLDRLVKSRLYPQGASSATFSDFTYDSNGNVVTRRTNGTENVSSGSQTAAPRVQNFTFDTADRMITQIDDGRPDNGVAAHKLEIEYFPTGWQKVRKLYRKVSGSWSIKTTTTRGYFDNGALKTLKTEGSTGNLLEEHTQDFVNNGVYVNGNVVKDEFTNKLSPSTSPCQTLCTNAYTYDGRDRLKALGRSPAAFTPNNVTYALDNQGNISSVTEDGSVTKSYTYDGDRIQTLTQGGTTFNYTYDPFGNLDCVKPDTSGGCSGANAVDYVYDGLDRLKSYKAWNSSGAVSDTATYTYDPLDRVYKETETHGAVQKNTTFTYLGGSNLVTLEAATGTSSSNKEFTYDAAGQRVNMLGASGPMAYSYDPQGSTSMLIKDDGAAGQEYGYGYMPYGELDPKVANNDTSLTAPQNPYRYQSRRYDSGSKSVDMGARRFATQDAHFLQQDMLQSALGDMSLSLDPLTQNRYALAGGNPVSYAEWDGHMVLSNNKSNNGGSLWFGEEEEAKFKRAVMRGVLEENGIGNGGGPMDVVKQGLGVLKGIGEGGRDFGAFIWNGTGRCIYDPGACAAQGQKYEQFWAYAKRDPIGATKALGYGFVEPILSDWRNGNYGEAVGRVTFDALLLRAGRIVPGEAADDIAVIGKVDDFENVVLRAGERPLDLPNLHNPRANWYQNAGALRQEMGRGFPIRDISIDPMTGELVNNTGFLRAERYLLQERGWVFDPKTGYWRPPGG
ncbi:MAG: hypothetical protein QOG54_2718 [Actinomycetota bacterium]|nr:hypothetical protein [Actinomycetota bacterium]